MASTKKKSNIKTYTDRFGRVIDVDSIVMYTESRAQGRAAIRFGRVEKMSYGNLHVAGDWQGIKPHNVIKVSAKFQALFESGEIFTI